MLVELFKENSKTASLGNCEDSAQDDATIDEIKSNIAPVLLPKKLKGNFPQIKNLNYPM